MNDSPVKLTDADRDSANRDELGEPTFRIPAHRLFVVRRYDYECKPIETTLEAHLCQPNERGMVCFYDFERTSAGEPTMRLHHVFYHVEDVEEVIRALPPASRIAH